MPEERIPTTERLATALREADAPQEMIKRAKAGYYDDFKSELAMPSTQLIYDAKRFRLNGILKRATEGEFDSPKWESDEWANDVEGKAIFAEFGHLLPGNDA